MIETFLWLPVRLRSGRARLENLEIFSSHLDFYRTLEVWVILKCVRGPVFTSLPTVLHVLTAMLVDIATSLIPSVAPPWIRGVLLPHFQAKLASGKVPAAAHGVIEYLQHSRGFKTLNIPEVPESLDVVLGQMSFSWLVSLFPFKNDPKFVETLDRLLLAYAERS